MSCDVHELVPSTARGLADGLYNTAVGAIAFPSLIAGILWTRVSPAAPFAFGAVLAALALIDLARACLAWGAPRRPNGQGKEHRHEHHRDRAGA